MKAKLIRVPLEGRKLAVMREPMPAHLEHGGKLTNTNPSFLSMVPVKSEIF
jgi:hypothetical protein